MSTFNLPVETSPSLFNRSVVLEKRTHRDYYRHSGNDKQPPIEYVYTYSEETPNQDMEKANQTVRVSDAILTPTTKTAGASNCLDSICIPKAEKLRASKKKAVSSKFFTLSFHVPSF